MNSSHFRSVNSAPSPSKKQGWSSLLRNRLSLRGVSSSSKQLAATAKSHITPKSARYAMPTLSSKRKLLLMSGKVERRASVKEQLKEYESKVEQIRALRNSAKQASNALLSRSGAIKYLSPPKSTSARQSLKKVLSPKQNKEIAAEFKKHPDMRDGLYYKLQDKKITTSKLGPLLSRSHDRIHTADDTFRRIEKGSERLSAQSTSRKEERQVTLSQNNTFDEEESCSILQQQSLQALHESHVLSSDKLKDSLFRLYRVQSDRNYLSLDKLQCQSFLDLGTQSYQSRPDDRTAAHLTPLQLEPQEVPSPSFSPSFEDEAGFDYEEGTPSRQFKSVGPEEPSRSLTPLMLPLKTEEYAQIVESRSVRGVPTRHISERIGSAKKDQEITAKAVMNLRRSAESEGNRRQVQKEALLGTLKSADLFEKADTLTHQWQSAQNLRESSLSNRGVLLPAGENKSEPEELTYPPRQKSQSDSPAAFKLPSLPVEEQTQRNSERVSVHPSARLIEPEEQKIEREDIELSCSQQKTPQDFKDPRSYSSLSLSSSSPPQQYKLTTENNQSQFPDGGIISQCSEPPASQTEENNIGAFSQNPPTSASSHPPPLPPIFKDMACAFPGINFTGVKQASSQMQEHDSRPDSALMSSVHGGDGQQTFRAQDPAFLSHSLSNSTLQGFPPYLGGAGGGYNEPLQQSFNTSMAPLPGEMEKNFLLAQYQYIVQQLNGQVKKLIERNEECERIIQNRGEADLLERLQHSERNNMQLQEELDMARRMNEAGHKGMEELRDSNKTVASQIGLLKGQIVRLQRSEQETRDKNEELSQRCFQFELSAQQKDEEIFTLRQQVGSLQGELRNMSQLQHQLQQEVQDQSSKRMEIESAFQEQRKLLYSHQLMVRGLQNENQNYQLERVNLLNSQQMMHKALEELTAESAKLKTCQTGAEHQKLMDRQNLVRVERENQRLQSELGRINSMLSVQRQAFLDLQRDYESAIGSPPAHMHSMAQSYSQMASQGVLRFHSPILPRPISVEPPNSQPEIKRMTPLPPPGSSEVLDTESSRLQLTDTFNYFKNRSNSVGNRGQNSTPGLDQVSPSYANNVRSSIVRLVHDPQGFSTQASNEESSIANLSSLPEHSRSVEGPSDDPYKYEDFRKRQTSSQMVGSLLKWSDQNEALKRRGTEYSAVRPLSSEQNKEKYSTTPKPTTTFPSYQKYEQEKQKVKHIERSLQELHEVKKKLESEYSKIPVKGGKRGLIQRKEELEKQLDSTDRSINQLKQRLRDMNVYSFHYAG